MGSSQDMQVIDEDPEVRTATIATECPPGDYTVDVALTSPDSETLAYATSSFSVVASTRDEMEHRLMSEYDANGNGVIDGSEILTAVRDYFAGDLTGEEILTLVRLYFANL